MNSILITGCNRGLGLGLVKALIGLPAPAPTHIIATYRDPAKSQVSACNFVHHIVFPPSPLPIPSRTYTATRTQPQRRVSGMIYKRLDAELSHTFC